MLFALWATALWRESSTRADAAPKSGKFIPAGDVEMFVQEKGPPDGPPVLLIHGTGAWGAIWGETMDELARAGYRAIAVDLPPFGFSERPSSNRYDDAAQADRLLAVLNSLKLQQVTLVGHSFGARPTVEAALKEPGRARLLVVVDGALNPASPVAPFEKPPFLIRALFGTSLTRDPLVASTLMNPLLTRKLFQQLILDPADATDAQVDMVQQQFPVAGTTHAVGVWLQQFLMSDAKALNHDAALYATLTMPSLVIWGREDSVTPLPRGEAIHRLLPQGELAILPNTGHIPAIEDPAAFHAALLTFLAAHRPM